jgi:hypothetical protein
MRNQNQSFLKKINKAQFRTIIHSVGLSFGKVERGQSIKGSKFDQRVAVSEWLQNKNFRNS